MRIATWNLERPKSRGYTKNALRLERIAEINADIWVLTETHSVISLDGYFGQSALSQPDYHSEGESYVAIWSRWPILRQLQTFDSHFAVCVEIDSSVGPIIVYGTIITYANDHGPTGKSRRWEEHRKSIEAHEKNWRELQSQNPNQHFCIAGDFNQSRDGSGWYEDSESVNRLSRIFDHLSVNCATEIDMRAHGLSRATIDHICVSQSLSSKVAAVGAWEGKCKTGRQLSDHNGVFIDIDRNAVDHPRIMRSERLEIL